MFVYGQKQTSAIAPHMSAFGRPADIILPALAIGLIGWEAEETAVIYRA